jgi:hypothetical protein
MKTDLLLESIFPVLEMLKEMRWQFMNVRDKSLRKHFKYRIRFQTKGCQRLSLGVC